ncbi:MAG: DNA mismatch repair protein MutS [Chloroflexales bacterium]
MAKVEIHQWYRQYRKLKAEAADAILLFRFGDFYETFDDDAKLIAELLDVTLTRKDFAVDKSLPKDQQKLFAPMAGMPYHAVERYVNDLVGRGYRVAIAEQLSETESSRSDTRPKSVFAGGIQQTAPGDFERKMVHREIVRVITPGTIIDPSMLTTTANNYLAATMIEGERIGLAYADLSTGEFAAIEFSGERAAAQLHGELSRLQVAEVLVPDDVRLRLPELAPAEARLTQDLAPMTKGERDLLLPHERVARRLDQASDARWAKGHVTAWPTWRWDAQTAQETLLRQLRVHSLSAFGLDDRPLATRAAGALLQYVHQTQRHQAAQLSSLRVYTTGSFMFLDPQTRRNLELLESTSSGGKTALVNILDRTRTPMGARLLRRWIAQPLLDLAPLQARQTAVARCVDETLMRAELRQALGEVGDMERAVNRVAQGTSVATPRDLVQLRAALRALPAVAVAVGAALGELVPEAAGDRRQAAGGGEQAAEEEEEDLFGDEIIHPSSFIPPPSSFIPPPSSFILDTCADIAALLERAMDDDPPAMLGASNYLRAVEEGGERPRRVIRPGFEPRIDALVRASRHAQDYIDRLEGRERERTGIKSLKVGYNSVFGYYIELSRTADEKLIPKDYQRKQTLVGAERYITEELKEYEQVIDRAKLQLVEMEREAFARICEDLGRHGDRLRGVARMLAHLDVVSALADTAVRGRYGRPVLNDSTRLRIVGGRHPVVEQMIPEAFVANDTTIDTDETQLLIITGPNMSGKSTVMRQVALIVLMAQIGSFVPAEAAEVGLVDRIFTRIGAQDDIATGQSTFMVEMTETAALLVQSSRRSLIILDEVGRGTSTYDGMAIARAVVEYIHDEPRLQCRTLFATHYHELTALEGPLARLRNLHMAAVEQGNSVVFLHELRSGSADRSYGIHVAELAGIPQSVILRASGLLAELEAGRRDAGGRMKDEERSAPAHPASLSPPPSNQLSLFDLAPSPVVEYLRRLNINELTPMDALNKLYELQRLLRE